MRIWGEVPKVNKVYETRKGAEKVEKTAAAAPKKDVVSISDNAKDFQTVMKALRSSPEVREDKISELSEKYHSGAADVKGKDIADKILKAASDKKI